MLPLWTCFPILHILPLVLSWSIAMLPLWTCLQILYITATSTVAVNSNAAYYGNEESEDDEWLPLYQIKKKQNLMVNIFDYEYNHLSVMCIA